MHPLPLFEGGIPMDKLMESFVAFNQNAASHLAYAISTNMWYLLLIVCCVTCIALYLKEEIAVTVREEQQAL